MLFVFSAFSYATDFLEHGYFRWGLILLFMFLKAGFIVAIFMHMAWERMALIWAILGPPVVLLVLIGLMAVEGDYTELTRLDFFSAPMRRPGTRKSIERAASLIAEGARDVGLVDWRCGFRAALGRAVAVEPESGLRSRVGLSGRAASYWLFSGQLTEYVTGMNEIPVWLPPLPIAIVVIALFYFGIKTWLNADKLPPPRRREHGRSRHDGTARLTRPPLNRPRVLPAQPSARRLRLGGSALQALAEHAHFLRGLLVAAPLRYLGPALVGRERLGIAARGRQRAAQRLPRGRVLGSSARQPPRGAPRPAHRRHRGSVSKREAQRGAVAALARAGLRDSQSDPV